MHEYLFSSHRPHCPTVAPVRYAREQLEQRLLFCNIVTFFPINWGIATLFIPPSPTYVPRDRAEEYVSVDTGLNPVSNTILGFRECSLCFGLAVLSLSFSVSVYLSIYLSISLYIYISI